MWLGPDLPIPPADIVPLPLPVSVFKVLLLATFGVHIVAVDIGVGGSILCLWLAYKGRSSPEHARIANAVAWVLPPAVTFAITLGVAPLLFVQLLYGRFLYTSSILIAIPWLSFVLALIAGYGLMYRHTRLIHEKRPSLGASLASTLFLLWVGFLWTNNVTLMLTPQRWSAVASSAAHGGTLNLGDPTVLPRFLHMALAMTAAAALLLAAATAWLENDEVLDRPLARRFGLRTFAFITMAQLAVGPAVLLLQPSAVRSGLLGGSPRALAALVVAVPCALGAVATALAGVDPKTGRRGVLLPLGLVSTTIAGMIVLRDEVRDLSLAAVGFRVEETPVAVDVVATALFAGSLVLLVVSLRMMFGWLAEGRRPRLAAKVGEVPSGG